MAVPLTPTIAKLRTFPQNKNRRSSAAPPRQPKLTRSLAQRFCDIIAETDDSIFDIIERNPGLPHHKTLFNWQLRVPWFAQMWKDARIRQSHFLAQRCLALAKSCDPKTAHVVRVKFDIYKFVMARFNPDFFGDRPPAAQQSTTVNVGISISPERLTEIRTKLDSTRSALTPRSSHASKLECASGTHRKQLANGSANGDRKAQPEPGPQPAP